MVSQPPTPTPLPRPGAGRSPGHQLRSCPVARQGLARKLVVCVSCFFGLEHGGNLQTDKGRKVQGGTQGAGTVVVLVG